MLRPNKHANPDQTVIGVATIVLKQLKSNKVESFSKIEDNIEQHVPGGKYLMIPALDLLYMLGIIEYHQKNDVFEFVGAGQ